MTQSWSDNIGMNWLCEFVCKPPPIAKAYGIRSPKPSPGECEEILDHLVTFGQNGELFVAEASGPKACDERGVQNASGHCRRRS